MSKQLLPEIGARATLSVALTEAHVRRFAEHIGDDNPLHMDDDFARALGFPGRVAHGMSYAAFLSTLIGTRLPGPGALWAAQTYRFAAPAFIGDEITLAAEVVEAVPATRTLRLAIEATAADGRLVMEGESTVVVPGAEIGEAGATRVAAAGAEPRVALIAGAGGGLGSAIAAALARDGYSLALCGRSAERNAAAAKNLRESGVDAVATALDLTDTESVNDAVAAIRDAVGAPSLVVHAASAALPNAGAESTDWQVFRRHFEIQAGGMHRLLRSTAPAMIESGGGLFIYIGSTATHGAPPSGMAPYAAAKAAATQLAKSIALELAPKGIRANVVSPGFMATDLTASVPSKARKLAAARSPLRRLAEVGEISSAVAFLSSGQSAYINGHDLVIDGGRTMA
ncbi:MAG TPA: SDR family oxidoreductase [Alphaproteobacteria bacterium]|jgi:3-oxoacyl-[acyl-carrier protein] reductase|nr:SDR family oxidoreductase [Alphaproteobacteria bacterium]HJN60419.1 SDR family oxidoreductase [Alphaproteobacteria bacterium]